MKVNENSLGGKSLSKNITITENHCSSNKIQTEKVLALCFSSVTLVVI